MYLSRRMYFRGVNIATAQKVFQFSTLWLNQLLGGCIKIRTLILWHNVAGRDKTIIVRR